MNPREYQTSKQRRMVLEKELGVSLSHIGDGTLDEETASTRNCENMIGVAQIPMGIAGPLILSNIHEEGLKRYYIPLATTEGALVASVSRGCKAITESGGAHVHSHKTGATRGPVFKVRNLEDNAKLYSFIKTHIDEFKEIAGRTSHHLKLKKVSSKGVGLYRYVRFIYDTGDAMGMNMVTIATEPIVRYIEEKTGTTCISLSGNFCVDKKPSWLNFTHNRGIKVWAEVIISGKTLRDVLKTSAEAIYEVWISKCMIGSAMSGSMGYNAQYANVIAALFLATGQDAAHVVEGSLGITTAEIILPEVKDQKAKNDSRRSEDNQNETNLSGLYISTYLPDLMVGTIGGGTGLATQREALSVLGVAGGNEGKNSQLLAEIAGAAVLAGEISLLASLAEGSLARAHQRLGRGVFTKLKSQISPPNVVKGA